jgi:hypothetical protein
LSSEPQRSLQIRPPSVRVADTAASGLGVFAARDFEPGEIVEVAPVLLLPDGQSGLPERLRRRTYAWGVLSGAGGGVEAVVWGYGSLYNHANPACMSYSADVERTCIVYRAERAIRAGEELTINYECQGGGIASDGDGWQTRHGIHLA